ncbi:MULTISPECIES: hypothetical protein [Neobacillus]|uniref:ATP-dependent DNA helicase n=1 Tax=Neobacillus citreus TaxID=2833578 RepID=A0A942T512_9BACI|nr:hypothetical protein [Neobacillus citreus]MCH6268532.1 hypothetical protein [Neobacillus citreus]
MRILFILLALFCPAVSVVQAETAISGKVENIDLNIKEHEMAVTFIGLSAGEATLIQGPNNENILVNVGGQNTEAELEEWLKLYDVKSIQTLIITTDENSLSFKKVNKLMDKYNIEKLITTPKISAQAAFGLDDQKQAAVSTWKEGTAESLFPDLTAEVQFVGNEKNEGMDFILKFFNHRLFLMSSCSERAEQALLTKNLEDVHVLKIPDYAKASFLSTNFIHYLNPEISVLFTPEEYHPDRDILQGLHETWSEVYFTKKHGTVTLKFTDSKYEVFTIPTEEE